MVNQITWDYFNILFENIGPKKNSLQYMAYSSTGFLLKNILYQNKVEWDESSESFMCKFSLWAPKINTDTRIL